MKEQSRIMCKAYSAVHASFLLVTAEPGATAKGRICCVTAEHSRRVVNLLVANRLVPVELMWLSKSGSRMSGAP